MYLFNVNFFIIFFISFYLKLKRVYYLILIKQIFFFKHDYKINPPVNNLNLVAYINPASFRNKEDTSNGLNASRVEFNPSNITINSALSSTISVLTLLLILFIYIPGE